MTAYVLPHTIPQEDARLTLMSRMLDPQLFFRLEQAGVAPGWRCLEVGAGNGSVSAWLAGRVGAGGHVVASDVDTRYIDRLAVANLEARRLDVVRDPLGADYDLVCARALLHHVPERIDALARMAAAVRPGGVIVVEEPDFHPTLASGNPVMRAFWEGWLAWAADQGIDYFVGRRIAPWLARLGFDEIEAHGETILYNGGALPAQYLKLTMQELEAPLRGSGLIAPSVWAEAMALFDAPQAWSWQNCYVTTVAAIPPTRIGPAPAKSAPGRMGGAGTPRSWR